ncbi:MAG: hypothetical protein QM726_21320 [Chitinophagaceae bacterium]
MQVLKPFKYTSFSQKDRLTTVADLLTHVPLDHLDHILREQDNQFLVMLSNTSLVLKHDSLHIAITGMLQQRIERN